MAGEVLMALREELESSRTKMRGPRCTMLVQDEAEDRLFRGGRIRIVPRETT